MSTMPAASSTYVRAMRAEDVPRAVTIAALAFGDSEQDAAAVRRSQERIRHMLRTDPEGAFVAERDGTVIGNALALRREGLWCLSLLTVVPGEQSAGAGSALLRSALGYGASSDPGLIISSQDPRAQALYRRSGFELRSTSQAEGVLDRARLPAPDAAVRVADASDLESLADVSRRLRGASHVADLEFALAQSSLILRLGERGVAVVAPGRGISMVAARDEDCAQTMLWHALDAVGECDQPLVRWITAEQRWAVEVVSSAGLQLTPYGALGVRGRPGPLRPYLPWGAFG
jgi:predicted N-acetyltransferase YhbS